MAVPFLLWAKFDLEIVGCVFLTYCKVDGGGSVSWSCSEMLFLWSGDVIGVKGHEGLMLSSQMEEMPSGQVYLSSHLDISWLRPAITNLRSWSTQQCLRGDTQKRRYHCPNVKSDFQSETVIFSKTLRFYSCSSVVSATILMYLSAPLVPRPLQTLKVRLCPAAQTSSLCWTVCHVLRSSGTVSQPCWLWRLSAGCFSNGVLNNSIGFTCCPICSSCSFVHDFGQFLGFKK